MDVVTRGGETIRSLKQRVLRVHPQLAGEHLKIVYQGRVLRDDSTLTDSRLRSGIVIQVMVLSRSAV